MHHRRSRTAVKIGEFGRFAAGKAFLRLRDGRPRPRRFVAPLRRRSEPTWRDRDGSVTRRGQVLELAAELVPGSCQRPAERRPECGLRSRQSSGALIFRREFRNARREFRNCLGEWSGRIGGVRCRGRLAGPFGTLLRRDRDPGRPPAPLPRPRQMSKLMVVLARLRPVSVHPITDSNKPEAGDGPLPVPGGQGWSVGNLFPRVRVCE